MEGHVATVAGTPIPIAWVEERLTELRLGRLGRQIPPEGGESERLRRWVVQELVGRMIELHEAHAAGLVVAVGSEALTPKAVAACPPLPADVPQRLFERVTANVTVPEDVVRDYYERNRDLYQRPETRRIRYAIAATGTASRGLLDRCAPSEAHAHSSGVGLGEVTALERGQLAGPLEEALFGAEVGEVVGPFRFADGWISARLEEIGAPSVASFDDVGVTIAAELATAAKRRVYEEWMAARRAALAVIEPAYEHPGHPIHGLPSHRH
jgi:[acyl-carrier-protein] S-malonyltransferase